MKSKSLNGLALGALLFAAIGVHADESGFKSMFNGKDLSGWDGNPKLWSVKDGSIVGQTTAENAIKANTFLIWKDGKTEDFELRCSFRITSQNDKGFANSGIQYRSKVLDASQWIMGGYQADMEAGPSYTGILYDEKGVAGGRGIMATRGEKVLWTKDCKKEVTGKTGSAEEFADAIKKNDWNEYIVIARGNHLQHIINGKTTVDVTDECESKFVKSGDLGLQLHVGGPMKVEFKNLRIKKLSTDTAASGDYKKLNGKWKIGGGEVNGSTIAEEDVASIDLTVTDGSYEVVTNEGTERGAFTVDPAKSPKEMDIRPSDGKNAGKTIHAIYETSREGFRVCYGAPDGERPTKFATGDGGAEMLLSYKRAK